MNILCLKDLPVEVDLGVEAAGYIPDYSKFGNTSEEFDMRRIGIIVEGYQVAGIATDGKLYIEAVIAPSVAGWTASFAVDPASICVENESMHSTIV